MPATSVPKPKPVKQPAIIPFEEPLPEPKNKPHGMGWKFPSDPIDIPKKKLLNLYEEVRGVLSTAIESGGSTDRNYVDAEGKKGSYMSFARVFRREGKPCQSCGEIIIKIRVAGRGTHICPNCQRGPK